MNKNVNLVEIFYIADESCKDFYKSMEGHTLAENNAKKKRNRPSKLNDAEVITILIAFHLSGYRNLKHFYIYYVQKHLNSYFPQTVSYNRFVELQKNICQVEHSRHRSFANFITNMISGLLAYSFLPKKPRIKYETVNVYGQLAIF